jgi:hypothetical protein
MPGTHARRGVYADPALPHQLRVVADAKLDLLAVSCNCMKDEDGRFIPLTEPARNYDPAQALAAYREHMEEVSGP